MGMGGNSEGGSLSHTTHLSDMAPPCHDASLGQQVHDSRLHLGQVHDSHLHLGQVNDSRLRQVALPHRGAQCSTADIISSKGWLEACCSE